MTYQNTVSLRENLSLALARCEWMNECPFFQGRLAQDMPLVADAMKKRFCLENKGACAVYRVIRTCGRENTPSWLNPNQESLADDIIFGRRRQAG